MNRPLSLLFASLAAFLLLFPLAVPRPGMPVTLKADEPAYYLAALSLVEDGDLLCETKDLQRLFDEYPVIPPENLILMSDDGWKTAKFGKPYLYSLLVAPAAALFGGGGAVAFNMALLLGMAWMGFRYLRRWNEPGLSALFSGAFFFVGPAFIYAFWLQPEVLIMFGVAACYYLGLLDPEGSGPSENAENVENVEEADGAEVERKRIPVLTAAFENPTIRLVLSAAALAVAVYHKPMFAAFGLPVLVSLWRRRGWRSALVWTAGAVGSMAAIVGLSIALSGAPSAYFGHARAGIKVDDPQKFEEILRPIKPMSTQAVERDDQQLSTYGWLVRVPEFFPGMWKENIGYFLWGRHTGLLLYMPFAALAVLLFLLNDRRSVVKWVNLAALVGVALYFIIWIHYNWHGGSGFVGNRYFAGAYPAFLFLVTRVRPAWTVFAGFVTGGIFLSPILFSPYGASVPDPTLQFHARGFAHERLPSELTLTHNLPGYEEMWANGLNFRGRRDLIEVRETGTGALWVRGAATAEIWAKSAKPLDSLLFEVSSPLTDNDVTVELGPERESVSFLSDEDGRESALLEFTPSRASKVWYEYEKKFHGYRFLVTPRTGRNPRHPNGEYVQPQFYLGAQLVYLGTRARLTKKSRYRLAWTDAEGHEAPAEVEPGRTFEVLATVQNAGKETWPASGALAVKVLHRWLDGLDEENRPVTEGSPVAPARRVTPGSWTQVPLEVTAPDREGAYILELDAVREGIATFSERGAPTHRIEITVAANTPDETSSR